MKINLSVLLIAISAVVTFAQTGVTQLSGLTSAELGIAVFVLGCIHVFLAAVTGPSNPPAS